MSDQATTTVRDADALDAEVAQLRNQAPRAARGRAPSRPVPATANGAGCATTRRGTPKPRGTPARGRPSRRNNSTTPPKTSR